MRVIIKLRDGKIIKACIFSMFTNSITLNNRFTISFKLIKEIIILMN